MCLHTIKSILLVEDELLLAQLTRMQLERVGFSVEIAENGRVAMMSLARKVPDLMITDLFMDEMDGLETISLVKRSYPAVRIIAISGGRASLTMDFLPLAKAMGADRTIAKPTEFSDLLGLIMELDVPPIPPANPPAERPRE